jgi:hypothetical protein
MWSWGDDPTVRSVVLGNYAINKKTHTTRFPETPLGMKTMPAFFQSASASPAQKEPVSE